MFLFKRLNPSNKRVVDCYSISVTNGGSTIFSKTYSNGTSKVYEYKSENGKLIYSSDRLSGYNYDTGIEVDYIIRTYPDRYTLEYTDYHYSSFVGWLTVENNYLLDLDNRTIDSETKWSEYLYSANPSGEKTDNKKAFKCAKGSYYNVNDIYGGGFYSTDDGQYYYVLKMDLVENGLERHTYTKLGEDSVITYKAKWF